MYPRYIIFIFMLILSEVKLQIDLARGFGDGIAWQTLSEATEQAQKTGKPVMVIIHKSWCSSCKAFKPKFANSKEIFKLSKEFLMVNLLDKEEPKDKKFSPDGGYIPRILFFDSDLTLRRELYNINGNPNYKYFYHDVNDVAKTMKNAISSIQNTKKKEL